MVYDNKVGQMVSQTNHKDWGSGDNNNNEKTGQHSLSSTPKIDLKQRAKASALCALMDLHFPLCGILLETIYAVAHLISSLYHLQAVVVP